ncbi:MAG: metallophosphoesterase [Acidobacteriota bacterium]
MKNSWLFGVFGAALIGLSPLLAQEPTPPPPDPVLVGAGDIADCSEIESARKTAALVEQIGGTVFTLGDNAYGSGTPEQFANCYAPTWGRFKDRTRPAAGNHDYLTLGAAGYFAYFGAAAGDPKKGYYSYDLGAWHVIVINSNCQEIGGCQKGSTQEKWLREDLAAHPALCSAAMWHQPRFSSADHGDDPGMSAIWKALYEAGAELVLSGHDHTYERLAPMDDRGGSDPQKGVRQFVAGTGGRYLYNWGTIHPTSEVRNNQTFGVLKLTLHPDSYDWQFVPADGSGFTDSGSAKCH